MPSSRTPRPAERSTGARESSRAGLAEFLPCGLYDGFGPFVAAISRIAAGRRRISASLSRPSGLAGLLTQVPAGELLDKTQMKRLWSASGRRPSRWWPWSMRCGQAWRPSSPRACSRVRLGAFSGRGSPPSAWVSSTRTCSLNGSGAINASPRSAALPRPRSWETIGYALSSDTFSSRPPAWKSRFLWRLPGFAPPTFISVGLAAPPIIMTRVPAGQPRRTLQRSPSPDVRLVPVSVPARQCLAAAAGRGDDCTYRWTPVIGHHIGDDRRSPDHRCRAGARGGPDREELGTPAAAAHRVQHRPNSVSAVCRDRQAGVPRWRPGAKTA